MDLLSIENITAGYGREPVIRDISFGIPQGGILGIVGPNGAGKTTLFKVISRLLKPSKGYVRYGGADIAGFPRKTFARMVSVVPQLRSVPPPFTVEEFVFLGRYPHKTRLARMDDKDRLIVEAHLKMLNLTHLKENLVTALSGGEMQRVFLAQGLVQTPELILMDEPTTHLDITHKIRVLDVIGSLSRQSGLTALLILHDLNLAGAYCDRVIMMKDGCVVAMGSADDVFTEELITEVYGIPVRVGVNPVTSKPHIFFLSQSLLNARTSIL